jgi:predicted peroxiredoxin
MGTYLVIESRDPFDSADVDDLYDLAGGIADGANDVTVFLVQNGVLPTRRDCTAAGRLAELAGKVTVLADDFSLRERGIRQEDLVPGVRTAGIDTLVDLAASDGCKVIWH